MCKSKWPGHSYTTPNPALTDTAISLGLGSERTHYLGRVLLQLNVLKDQLPNMCRRS